MTDLPPWLETQLGEARQVIQQERLGHALLIHGPSGWGERALANALALELLGESNAVDAANLAHPDLRWLAPETDSAQIKIDDIRAIADFAVQTPQISDRKIIVLIAAERMNNHAANALLKTLEEPPGACHLILTSTAIAELLPTIRSRCQLMAIRPAAAAVAERWLQSHIYESGEESEPGRLEGLAFEYGGAAFAIADAVAREETPLQEDLMAVARGARDPLSVAEDWSKLDCDRLLARWMRYLHAGITRTPELNIPTGGDRSSRGGQLGDVSAERWQACYESLLQARAATRSTSNPNVRLMLEGLLLSWRDMFAPRR